MGCCAWNALLCGPIADITRAFERNVLQAVHVDGCHLKILFFFVPIITVRIYSLPENGGAYSYHSSPFRYGNFKVAAHTHREFTRRNVCNRQLVQKLLYFPEFLITTPYQYFILTKKTNSH